MLPLRLLLACLIMLAVPLQGFAAASMLFCAGSAGHHVAAPGQDHEHAPAMGSGYQHSHAAADHAHPADGHLAPGSPLVSERTSAGDAPHVCGVCASCCHSVAISETVHVSVVTPLPQHEPSEPLLHLDTRPAVVPDKPPRA